MPQLNELEGDQSPVFSHELMVEGGLGTMPSKMDINLISRRFCYVGTAILPDAERFFCSASQSARP